MKRMLAAFAEAAFIAIDEHFQGFHTLRTWNERKRAEREQAWHNVGFMEHTRILNHTPAWTHMCIQTKTQSYTYSHKYTQNLSLVFRCRSDT
jgi:hypothetical protein